MTAEAWVRQRTALALVVLVMVGALGAIFDREWRDGDVFSPADLVFQFYPWAYTAERQVGANPTRSDEAFYHQPLMATHFARVRDGSLPDLDASRLSGVPSFFQGLDTGRLISPFSLPFYVMPADAAVSLYGPLRLLVAALCMWALLRGLGLSPPAAALGGVAYGLNGPFLVWLSAPMPTVAAWLPLALLFARHTTRTPSMRHVALLALAVGLMATGGYMATLLACLMALALFAAVDVAVTRQWRALPWLAAGVGAGLVLGAGALGPMLVSLASSSAAGRVVSADGAGWANLATLALPDFWGTPLHGNWWHPDPSANYPEHVAYFGVPVLVLAGAGVASLRRRCPAGWSAVALLLIGLTRAYGVPPGRWLVLLPGQPQSNPFRWYVIVACALAVLAGLGLQALLTGRDDDDGAPRRSWRPLVGAALALLVLGGVTATAVAAYLPEIRALNLQALERGQLTRFAVLAGMTALLTLATWAWPVVRGRHVAAILLVVLAAGDLAQANRRFNPTVPRDRYYPATTGLAWLSEQAMGTRIAPIDDQAELVEGHVWSLFGIATVTGFDFHGDTTYQRFLRAAQHRPEPDTTPTVWDFVGLRTTNVDLSLLGLLGVRYIVTSPVDVTPRAGGYVPLGELMPGHPVRFTFRPRFDGLRRVDVLTATYQRRNQGALRIVLSNAAGIELAARTVPVAQVPDNDWLSLSFPPAFPSAGEVFELRVEGVGTRPDAAPTLWRTDGPGGIEGALTVGGTPVDGALWIRAFSTAPERVPGTTLAYAGDLNVYGNPYTQPPAWFVDRVRTASPDTHVSAMQTAGFDARREAMLSREPGVEASMTARVTSVSVEDDARRYRVDAPDGGVLIIGERAHDGWRVRIDGQESEWQTADGVLMAVTVPARAHLVSIEYTQPFLRPFLGLSCLAFAGIVFALVLSSRRR